MHDSFVVVSVAQGWNELKGLFKIFEAARQLPEDKFVLVGRMAYEGEMPTNVVSVGVTSSTDELAQYYSMADAFWCVLCKKLLVRFWQRRWHVEHM